MRALVLELEWHEQQRGVFSVDIAADGTIATGGQDKRVSLWRLEPDWEQLRALAAQPHEPSKKQRYALAQAAAQSVRFLDTLEGHAAAVSVVRFDPVDSGRLVSGADDGYAVLWKFDAVQGKWRLEATLHEHNDMIMDVSWSADGKLLATASVDNTVAIWNTTDSTRPQLLLSLREHTNYVQGVSWDPLGTYLCSMGADRLLRVHEWSPDRRRVIRSTAVGSMLHSDATAHPCMNADASCPPSYSEMQQITPAPSHPLESEPRKPSSRRLFESEGLMHFFRRLAWSPDGSFLVCPAGIVPEPRDAAPTCSSRDAASHRTKGAHVFARSNLSTPLLHLGGHEESILGARFCSRRFARRQDPTLDEDLGCWRSRLPYRLVFAIYSARGLYMYDSETPHSFAAVQGLHYGAVTDVAWSPDASFLLMSSLDGFLSLVWFERETELGKFFEESGELQTGSRSSPSTPLTTGSCSLDGGQGSHRSADPVMRCNREQPIASTLVSSDADSGHGRNTDHSTKVGEHAVSSTT